MERGLDESILRHSYEMDGQAETRSGFLANAIFGFITYDDDIDTIFGRKAVEVCLAITEKRTFAYQEETDNYQWYLLMVNMPFFRDKLEWGTSIRGAWWNIHGDDTFTLTSDGLWVGREQQTTWTFHEKSWEAFIFAMAKFIGMEVTDAQKSE
jgi:hypothetical protein